MIESPCPDDLLNERTEGRALSEVLKLASIRYRYNLVTNNETFITALYTRLEEALNEYGLPPILHLSMHGYRNSDGVPDGIVLTNGNTLSWSDLRELLKPLNNLMAGGLLICMSSCYGSYAYQMAMLESEDQPFFALVGNNSSVFWQDAAVAYVTFYHLLFKGIPIYECVERMKWASGDDRFNVWSGHELKKGWNEYVKGMRKKESNKVLRRAIELARQQLDISRQNRYQ